MADHIYTASVTWERGEQPFLDRKYSRGHVLAFDGGVSIAGSSSPLTVRPPLSKIDAVDPEEALVAALSSCHMLFFLDFASKAGIRIDRYADAAEGRMGRGADGRVFVTHVTLKPQLTISGEKRPTTQEIADLHHRSHEACFIANTVKSEVVVAEVAPIFV